MKFFLSAKMDTLRSMSGMMKKLLNRITVRLEGTAGDYLVCHLKEMTRKASSCSREGSVWILGKFYSQK